MKKVLYIFVAACLSLTLSAQWVAKQPLGTINQRSFAASFSVLGYGYVIGGKNSGGNLNDVWRYDTLSNSWSKISDFPGGPIEGAVGFAVGSKGYLVAGKNVGFSDEVWEYDPVGDSWTEIGYFPGGMRKDAVAFVIGNKAYVGTGYFEYFFPTPVGVNINDFWEYTPSSNTWVQKANVPGIARAWSVAGVANGKGYLGLGGNGAHTMAVSDFYEYDPTSDTWTAKATLAPLAHCASFSYGSEIYVLGGINLASNTASNSLYRYNPVQNTWTNEGIFPGGQIKSGVSIELGSRVFVGTGLDQADLNKDDWWQFKKCTSFSVDVTTTSSGGNNICNGKITFSHTPTSCTPINYQLTPTAQLTNQGSSFTFNGLCVGNYTLTIKDNECCGSMQKIIQVQNGDLVGVDENSLSATSIIYPNPAQGTFCLRGNEKQCTNLQVRDEFGRLVDYKREIVSDENLIQINIQTKGIYFLHYKIGDVSKVEKVIVY